MLYHNFIDDIKPDAQIKYTCENKGRCCNLKHFELNEKEKTPEIKENSKIELDFNEKEEIDENIFKFDDD